MLTVQNRKQAATKGKVKKAVLPEGINMIPIMVNDHEVVITTPYKITGELMRDMTQYVKHVEATSEAKHIVRRIQS